MTRTPSAAELVRRLLVVSALVAGGAGLLLPSCRLITREVACARDRDCPDHPDGGIPYCTRWLDWDSGVGVCTDDPAFEGDRRDTGEEDGGTDDGGLPFPIEP